MTDKVALALFRQFVRKGAITMSIGLGKPVVIAGDIPGPNVSVHIENSALLRRIVAKPDIAIGEAYMDNSLVIENDDLESLMHFLFENASQWKNHMAGRISLFMNKRLAFLHHWNLPGVSRRNVAHHYDLTDALFDSFLDPRRQYSCGYYEHPDVGITNAQNNKLARITAKLHLSKGDQILDIGCG